VMDGQAATFRLQADKSFKNPNGVVLSDAALRALAKVPGQEVTFTCLPPGW